MAVIMDIKFRRKLLNWIKSKESVSIYELVEKWESEIEYEQLLSIVYILVGLGLLALRVSDSDSGEEMIFISATDLTITYLERTGR